MIKILLLLLFPLIFSYSKDIAKPEDILKSIYPSATVEVRDIVLSEKQVKEVEKLSRVKLNTRFVTFYIVKKGNKVIAYGYVDIHRVRTKPEAVLYVISPEGKIELIEILAFHEPLEYLPPKNWLKLFQGKDINAPLRVKKDIPNLTGATLTARAIAKNTRKVLALWKVLFGGGK
ncbi:MAG: FMN-binding protein [Aquifex sp.]|nr:MAG: FMN-binding protein [Aquifex sp.]